MTHVKTIKKIFFYYSYLTAKIKHSLLINFFEIFVTICSKFLIYKCYLFILGYNEFSLFLMIWISVLKLSEKVF